MSQDYIILFSSVKQETKDVDDLKDQFAKTYTPFAEAMNKPKFFRRG